MGGWWGAGVVCFAGCVPGGGEGGSRPISPVAPHF